MFCLTKKTTDFCGFFYPVCHFFCIFILSKYRIKYHDNALISPIYDICQITREYEIRYPSDVIVHPSQVSKAIFHVKIQKWHWPTYPLTKVRYIELPGQLRSKSIRFGGRRLGEALGKLTCNKTDEFCELCEQPLHLSASRVAVALQGCHHPSCRKED